MPQTPYNAPVGLSYDHISNAGTVIVKAKPGMLASVNVNSYSTGATLELFDNNVTVTGTTVIGDITLTGTVGTPVAIPYNVTLNTGLVVVSTGTVDATVIYR